MQWHIKTFKELTRDELWAIYNARTSTFVVEQKRPYQEVDKLDKKSLHIWADDDEGVLLAYARIYYGHDHTSFGRVLTTKAARGKGLGKQLVQKILDVIAQHFDNNPTIEIDAQEDKVGFYEKFGFHPVGGVYTFHQTPHIKMVLNQ